MQTSDKRKVATPADWRPGKKVIAPPPGSHRQADKKAAEAGDGYEFQYWFLCFKNLTE